MWIVPKNFSGTYPFVQGIQDLGLDSNEFCQLCERSLMSKSKPTQFKTWLTRWNKDSYLQRLCTQTLKPSHSQTFVDAWTSYLAAFPASHLAKPEQEDQQKTHGISSPTLPMESTPVQQDMFSSRMSKESSPPKPLTGKVFSDMSSENWKDCVYIRVRRSACVSVYIGVSICVVICVGVRSSAGIYIRVYIRVSIRVGICAGIYIRVSIRVGICVCIRIRCCSIVRCI